MKLSASVVFVVLLNFALWGCMLAPADGAHVSSRDSSIRFSGYAWEPNAAVQIEAYDVATGRFAAVGAARSDTVRLAESLFDDPLYAWSSAQVIPRRFWESGPVRGFKARLRATTTNPSDGQTSTMMSVDSTWSRCYSDGNRNIADFFSNCRSANSPDAYVYTSDWVEPLRGYVDMHAHPMTHLAFGGKLIHGAPDVGSLLPADSACQHRVRATSMQHALGPDNATHGGWGLFDNPCGDSIRAAVIDTLQSQLGGYVTPDWATGAPAFPDWPRWNDVTHQKMWVDWIKRAHGGGLRVMVALATHNQTLAAAVSGPGDGPTDDRGAAELQIEEMKSFVARHDFMEIVLGPSDLRRVVTAGKLAVVLGLEIDDIGGFNRGLSPSETAIRAEIRRLHGLGVRYMFPVHVIDNAFGGAAVYEDLFNLSNFREFGAFWDIGCGSADQKINKRFVPSGFDLAFAAVKATKLGIDPFRSPPTPPACRTASGAFLGHVNKRSLTTAGEIAVNEMMKLGVLIDIDHMSQRTADRTLEIADGIASGGYPINSGHNGYRGEGSSENSRTREQLEKIARLRGVIGVGWGGLDAHQFASSYAAVRDITGGRASGLGTDMNGLVQAPRPRAGSNLPATTLTGKTWDYDRDGVAHYGLLPEFIQDMRTAPGGNELVDRGLMNSAEAFAQMWERAETQRLRVP